MGLYEKYCRAPVDFEALGLARQPRRSDYLCTPKGARIIGWAGVDGIHYCFLKDFGEMVFAISPSNCMGQQVHPVARSFADFLSLLTASRGLDAVEQAWGWSEEDFHRYVEAQSCTAEREAALEEITRRFGVEAMAEPWHYIRELQDSFDDGAIPFTRAYLRELVAVQTPTEMDDWQVCYPGRKELPGFAHTIEKTAHWAGEDWYFPAWYECSSGVVLDGCMAVSHREVESYVRRWQEAGTEAERRVLEADNPMEAHADFSLTYGGVTLAQKYADCRYWMPCFTKRPEARERQWVEHYQLDQDKCWALWRIAFPWPGEGQPGLDRLELTILPEPEKVLLTSFSGREAGEKISFVHPVSGAEHTAEILGRKWEKVDVPDNNKVIWPRWCEEIRLKIKPPLKEAQVEDWAESDPPKYPDGRPIEQELVFLTCAPRDGTKAGLSARHYEPCPVEWHLTDQVIRRRSKTVLLFQST